MKNSITLLGLIAAGSVANADFIAGWDFSGASAATDMSSYSAEYGSGTLDSSNFSQQTDTDPAFGGAGSRADFGTFEAGIANETAAVQNPSEAFNNGLGFGAAQSFQVLVDGAHSGPTSFSFSADLTGFTFDSFQFQAKQGASDYTVGLTANGLDLGDVTPGTAFAFSDITDATGVVGGGNVGNSLDNQVVTFTFTLTGADEESNSSGTANPYNYDDAFLIDNVTFSGTVVPEPSAFALISGLLAIGFIGLRRRR